VSPQEQVAREMGRTVPLVRNLLNRALARLAALAQD
jgi:DNA-directed RNA polymerase specialized sigma24 family protein